MNGSRDNSMKHRYTTDPSGLLQLGARFYWPQIGRFIQQDPAKDGLNWYAYADGNPVVSVDPTGEGWRDWCLHYGDGGCIGPGCHGDPDCKPKSPKPEGPRPRSEPGGNGPVGGTPELTTPSGGGPNSGPVMSAAPPYVPSCDNRLPLVEDCRECLKFPGDPTHAHHACMRCCRRMLNVCVDVPCIRDKDEVRECFKMCSDYIAANQPTP